MSAQAKAFRVLFIGNSFTDISSTTIEHFRIVSPLGDDVFRYHAISGRSLDYHLQQQVTLDLINDGSWDYVMLQDHSQQTLFHLNLFNSAVREFANIVRDAGAEPVLFETWARLQTGGYSHRQAAVNSHYTNIAEELNIHVMSVGQVWLSIYNSNRSFFNRLHSDDRIHQTTTGSATVASAVYKVLYDTDLTWAPIDELSRQAVLINVSTRKAHTNRWGFAKKFAGLNASIFLLLD